jgi:hypothetical protein
VTKLVGIGAIREFPRSRCVANKASRPILEGSHVARGITTLNDAPSHSKVDWVRGLCE